STSMVAGRLVTPSSVSRGAVVVSTSGATVSVAAVSVGAVGGATVSVAAVSVAAMCVGTVGGATESVPVVASNLTGSLPLALPDDSAGSMSAEDSVADRHSAGRYEGK